MGSHCHRTYHDQYMSVPTVKVFLYIKLFYSFNIKIKDKYIYIMLALFQHPKSVCMTYIQHMKLSLYFSYHLWVGSVYALIHAFFPDHYITSTTDVCALLQKTLKSAGCHG